MGARVEDQRGKRKKEVFALTEPAVLPCMTQLSPSTLFQTRGSSSLVGN